MLWRSAPSWEVAHFFCALAAFAQARPPHLLAELGAARGGEEGERLALLVQQGAFGGARLGDCGARRRRRRLRASRLLVTFSVSP